VPTRFIGDVHGKFGRYKTILNNSPDNTIQVGDMGVGFRSHVTGDFSSNPPFDLMLKKGARFIRGNHDNPEVCRAHQMCVPDGQVEDNMMFIGGALSIDRAMRVEGYSWWRDEELSQNRLDQMVIEMQFAEPEIMVTHECPERIAAMIVAGIRDFRSGGAMKMDPRFASRTRVAFDEMFAGHKPKLWLFGHWHLPFDRVVDGTRFICLPELACLDVDTEKAEVVGELLTQRERW
jgi:hypothetical protein